MRRLVLCSGKLYYDIVGHEAHGAAARRRGGARRALYPFPREDLAALVGRYPALEELVWAQEEPQNMGPWRAIRHRLEEAKPAEVPLATSAGLACEPERGLSDGASAGAGAHRARSPRS